MDTLKQQIAALTALDFAALKAWVVTTETDRRAAQPFVQQEITTTITGLQDAGKLDGPAAGTSAESAEPWADPGTDHSLMYRLGGTVTHHGRTWESMHPHLNHWEPGPPGFDGRIWEDITPVAAEENPATGETITQWAPGIVATVGMKLTYNGSAYEVIQAHTTQADWLPDALPALYKRLG